MQLAVAKSASVVVDPKAAAKSLASSEIFHRGLSNRLDSFEKQQAERTTKEDEIKVSGVTLVPRCRPCTTLILVHIVSPVTIDPYWAAKTPRNKLCFWPFVVQRR